MQRQFVIPNQQDDHPRCSRLFLRSTQHLNLLHLLQTIPCCLFPQLRHSPSVWTGNPSLGKSGLHVMPARERRSNAAKFDLLANAAVT